MNIAKTNRLIGSAVALMAMMAMSFGLHAAIPGIESNTFELHAKEAQITTPDGDAFKIWGFADGDGEAQYPGPTLLITQGDCVVITVHNDLPAGRPDISLALPGQEGKAGDGTDVCTNNTAGTGTVFDGTDSNVIAPGGSKTYRFRAENAGTYMYHSGVDPHVQIDMGLVGALIVRPTGAIPEKVDPPVDVAYQGIAYDDSPVIAEKSAYDQEYLFLMSEMDPRLHYLADNDTIDQYDNSTYKSVLWFINGRNAPDTLTGDGVPMLPHQPYGALMVMKPGERILIRTINAGRNQHPLHLHGNHYTQIARDGNVILTEEEANPGFIDYTLNAVQLSTADLIFEWTGKGMGWDIYGHAAEDPLEPYEDPMDHGKPLPVVIPESQDLAFGGLYGGSPFLGVTDSLPIGEGGLNPMGGMVHIWHSHSERELANNDIFPGGMITFMIVVKR